MEQRTLTKNVPDQKTEEVYRSMLQEILLPMFNAWLDSLDERGELGKLPCKVIAESYGCYGCTENSGLALMFNAFAGGAMAAVFDSREDKTSEEQGSK